MLNSITNTWEELIILINSALTIALVGHSTSGISIYFGYFDVSLCNAFILHKENVSHPGTHFALH